MRAALLLALAGAAVAAAILLARDSRRPPRRGERPEGDASEVEERRPAPPPPLPPPAGDESLEEFAARAAAGGPGAVAGLLAILEEGGDRTISPVWRLDGADVRPLPTLRAACLEALRRIPGPEADGALRTAWGLCRGAGESYLCALALSERKDASWAPAAVDRAGAAPDPPLLHVQAALVSLAAAVEPEATLLAVERAAPRGDSPADPQVPSAALRGLPGPSVRAAVERLIAEPAVTARARSRYLDSLFRRSDLAAVRALRDAAPLLAADTRIAAAHAAARSVAFDEDAAAAGAARANGDARAADAALARFEERMAETRLLVETLVAAGPTADAVLRILEDRRRALGG